MNNMTNVSADEIRGVISNDDPLWFPGLAEGLVNVWSITRGTTLASYSSSGLFNHGQLSPLAEQVVQLKCRATCSVIEVLHEQVQRTYELQGLSFALPEEAISLETCQRVQEAFAIIEGVQSLASSICQLVRRIHVLRAEDDAFDISHSDPQLPFSVFASVPVNSQRYQAWRLAEGFIHEAMHLQLSLIEQVAPMVKDGNLRYYSPWRKVERPIGGVLHGLYVFGVIYEWLGYLDISNQYVRERRQEIEDEVRQVKDFASISGLTKLGGLLATKAINRVMFKRPVSSPEDGRLSTERYLFP